MEPVLSRVASNNPGVYIKSLARTLGESREIDITLTSSGDDLPLLESLLDTAREELEQGLDDLDIRYRRKDRTEA